MASNISNTTMKNPSFRCFHPQFSIEFQYQYFNTTHSILAPLNTLCVLLSVFANSLILLTVRKHIGLRSPSSLLLCSLNMKDIVFVSFAETLQICESLLLLTKDDLCYRSLLGLVLLFFVFCGRSIGLLSMIMISIDRCFAIHKPHFYRRVLTRKRVFGFVAVVWITSIGVSSSAPFLSLTDLSSLMVVLFGSTTVVVTLLQIIIYYGVRHQRARTSDMSSSQLRQMVLERSVAIVVFYIVLGLAVCYIPFLSSVALIIFNGQNYVYFGRYWFQFAIYVNAIINPIIMLKTNRALRRAALDIVTQCFVCCDCPTVREFQLTDESSGNQRRGRSTNGTRPLHQNERSTDILKVEDI
ncbi:rhodopsin, GQ-coupled-like [Exaiptasia diaphana]|uniref:G-protein coupled receptors family 1 profile domain-containing protein n=1 Tax=Exaiptasia diaphana TaxID=2652724 RepID=A0A913Y4X5_EXADI|nr:rhodopsin, GQ-coupled-like [Exaiptasia diaphana]XP_020914474.1 rhodopsin, GQ-coupled-like [Exaiptasia diaphana]